MDEKIRNCEICPESSACALNEREVCVLDEKPDRFVEEDFQTFEKQYMEDYKDEIVSPYDRHAGLVDGMKWQKEKDLKGALMEPPSEDLEKAAIDYGNRTAWTDGDPFNWILEIAFKDGANWQKEQIAKSRRTEYGKSESK